MKTRYIAIMITIVFAIGFGGICYADEEDPVVDSSRTTKKLQSIKRPKGQRKVSLYMSFEARCRK